MTEDLRPDRQHRRGSVHAGPDDLLRGSIEQQRFASGQALRRADLRMGVVDVVTGTVGQHRVDEMGLDLRGEEIVDTEPTSVAARVLVVEVPSDLALMGGEVGVDQQRAGRDRVASASPTGPRTRMPYSVSTPHTFAIAMAAP